MRKSIRFQKPQPLSPNSQTWVEGNIRYQKNNNARGGKTSVRGVPTTDSIYYLWFEYLKRSEKYKTACANNGKGMAKLHKDFGNIFEYEGVEGFWSWWNERGQYLFGIEATQEIVEFDSADEVVGYEDYKLIAIPKNITATTIKKRLNKLVDDMKSELKPTAEQTAKYSIAQTKVDVESLKSCLMAYDLKQRGTDVLKIGLQVKWISGAEAKDLIEDGRKKGKEVDSQKLIELSENNSKEYGRLLAKAQAVISKRLKGNLIDSDNEDKLIDMEMRVYKTDYVRTSRKKSIRTNTHKLINKAVANIQAVEKGMFGLGHKVTSCVTSFN
ncbi:hypothetical protein OAQ01_03820 [Emcibacteraceae bacterium]|nr:hypothetical protein [Emcibacteraceae bacterium]